MSTADNSLFRSSSSESRKLSISKSHTRLNEAYIGRSNQEKPNPLSKNITKASLKPRVVLNAQIEKPSHKRAISDTGQKLSHETILFKEPLFLYQKFLGKVNFEQNIENKVNLLISLFLDLSKICPIFSDLFKKASGIIDDYSKFVKSLDSTRTDGLEPQIEIKNSIFRSETKNLIVLKPKITKRLVNEMSSENYSADFSREKDGFVKQRLSLTKIKSIGKLERFSQLKNKSFTKSIVPSIQLLSTEKVDFHEEFMSKFDEFSESWREEALKLRK
jgi:hypothetical protein